VVSGEERRNNSLESQAVTAHRAYLAALADWERAFVAANRPACSMDDATDRDRARRCTAAEAEKERRRVVFRDLCDKLGYVPREHGVTLQATGRAPRGG
jgi:hypothetical protein